MSDQEREWQSELLRDQQGGLLPWEHNADLILRNDPLIKEQVNRAGRDVERVALEAMLHLQQHYQIRLPYQMLTIMVKLISEAWLKKAKHAALSETGYYSRS